MPIPTTKLGLQKPQGVEPQDIDILNADLDILDKIAGGYLVNDGVTPPDTDLYPGCIVRENGTGIVWMAVPNGVGGYNKRYIFYPYNIVLRSSAAQVSITNDRNMRIAILNNGTILSGVNAAGTAVDLGSSNFCVKVPTKAIYFVKATVQWGVGSAALGAQDQRATTTYVDSAFLTTGVEQMVEYPRALAADRAEVRTYYTGQYNAGQQIRVGMWQNSGAVRDIGQVQLDVSLLTPLP